MWTNLEARRKNYEETKESKREYARRYRIENAEKLKKQRALRYKDNIAIEKIRHRNSHLKKTYGVTLDEYNSMYLSQDGKCAICLKHFDTLCVDHDHTTNKTRALLCLNCNSLLGMSFEDVDVLQTAINYIHTWRQRGQ